MNMSMECAAREALAALEAEDIEKARAVLTAALAGTEPDAVMEAAAPVRVKIRSRYRDLNARGRGVEAFRMVLDQATGKLMWADKHPDALVVSDDWCPRGIRASERHCATRVELPVGLIVVEVERSVGRGASRPSYAAGVVAAREDGTGEIRWERDVDGLRHVGVRRDGDTYVHVLEIDGERREVRS